MPDIEELLAIMARLRDPRAGCPWDLKQDFASIAPYTIEEAFEVADAIDRDDLDDLCGELGDLLLQVVFHSQMAKEEGAFEFADVVAAICEKMVRRHPHVFASATFETDEELRLAWEREKQRERHREGDAASALDGIARALPALMRAEKLQRRAVNAGFNWRQGGDILAKVREELAELEAAIAAGDAGNVEEELGDLLFVCVSLGLHAGSDPEQALRRANGKFEQRYRALEQSLHAQGRAVDDAGVEELSTLWQRVKKATTPGADETTAK